MSIVSATLPLFDSQFGYMVLGGIVVFMMSTYCRSAKVAARVEFAAFCACTTGSVPILKAIAELCRH
jgi:hypothetical protein